MPILSLTQPVTLVMPFTADQLVPGYWDTPTNSWKPVPNYSVTQTEDGSGSLSLSIEHFTVYASLAARQDSSLFLPLLAH
ncbi:MAG TPA: hypothetical protein VGJ97_05715 [Anaerolineaceae bacterium]